MVMKCPVNLIWFLTLLIPTSFALTCHSCYYDESNKETENCLLNPTTVEDCPSSQGYEGCETLSGVKSLNKSVRVIIPKCSENMFGFNCEEGYSKSYAVKNYQDGHLHVNLTQVKICFCRQDNCNQGDQQPWATMEEMTSDDSSKLTSETAVCHKCVSWVTDSSQEEMTLVNCPSVVCNNKDKTFPTCSVVQGISVDNDTKVIIRKCGHHGQVGCSHFKEPLYHYDDDGVKFKLTEAIHCNCQGDNCNDQVSSRATRDFLSNFSLFSGFLFILFTNLSFLL